MSFAIEEAYSGDKLHFTSVGSANITAEQHRRFRYITRSRLSIKTRCESDKPEASPGSSPIGGFFRVETEGNNLGGL